MSQKKNKEIVTVTYLSLLVHYKKGNDHQAEAYVNVASNCYMIAAAALCKLNKDNFESKIMIDRLFYLKYM